MGTDPSCRWRKSAKEGSVPFKSLQVSHEGSVPFKSLQVSKSREGSVPFKSLPIRALYKSGRMEELHNWRVRDLKQVAFIAA